MNRVMLGWFLAAGLSAAAIPPESCIAETWLSLKADKAEERKKCKLVLEFDGSTPPWLFWRTAPGSDACPDGASTCLTADGKPPPSNNISEGDEFEGECWDKMPDKTDGQDVPAEKDSGKVAIGYPVR